MKVDREFDKLYADDLKRLHRRVLDSGADAQTQARHLMLMSTYLVSA